MAPPVTNEDLFKRSSQWRQWTKTEAQLEELRAAVHERARRNFLNLIHDMDMDECMGHEVSVMESRQLVRYYTQKCSELGQFLKIDDEIIMTCMTYLKRFFLERSVVEFDIKGVMYTCLFLGCKSEDGMISLNKMCELIPNLNREDVLKYEWDILKVLKFQLMCHHPRRCVYGFYLDIQRIWGQSSRLDKCLEVSHWWCLESFKSDVMFKFTPSQIALACMLLSDEALVEGYLKAKTLEGEVEGVLDLVKRCAKEIREVHEEPLGLKEAKDVALKVNFMKDPQKYLSKVKRRKLN